MYLCVCMYPCGCAVHVRQQYSSGQSIGLLTEKSPAQCSAAAVVSLSKALYSQCSSPPGCINGDLAIAEEAIVKLCIYLT